MYSRFTERHGDTAIRYTLYERGENLMVERQISDKLADPIYDVFNCGRSKCKISALINGIIAMSLLWDVDPFEVTNHFIDDRIEDYSIDVAFNAVEILDEPDDEINSEIIEGLLAIVRADRVYA